MTGISNVELRHETNDRRRVLKRIKFKMINDTDMNALLVLMNLFCSSFVAFSSF
jgi:hypothetical protein